MESEIMRQYTQALAFRRKLDAGAFRRAEPYFPEDPLSKCMVAERSPCRPGAPCPYDAGEVCTPECGEYASYSEDGGEDR